MIAKGEIYFYNLIKEQCKIIFDIGCRDDIFYITMSDEKEFHLFEPNPVSFAKLMDKILHLPIGETNKIYANEYGLGNITSDLLYYPESESFFQRPEHFPMILEPTKLHIKKFSEYLDENNITKIDFLKIDTEGYEPDILFDSMEFIINNVKYVQFEYVTTWLDKGSAFSLTDVMTVFGSQFDFSFLLDEAHPIISLFGDNLTPIETDGMVQLIDNYMKKQYGFNIVMMRKA